MSGKIDIQDEVAGREDEWNVFVETSTNGTIFQRLDFLGYHPDDRFDECPLMFYYGGQNLLGVLPLAIVKEGGRRIAKSPYGGSYGGIVVKPALKFRYAKEMVEVLIDYLRYQNVDELVVRPTPREQHAFPSAYVDFHLVSAGARVVDRELTSVIDLRRIGSDRFDIYEGSCRTEIRKAERKGVEIEEWSDAWDQFYPILEETYARHGKEPTHTQSDLSQLAELFPDRIRMGLAYFEAEAVAGSVQFLVNDRTNLHFYNCHRETHRNVAPVNLLLDREIKWSLANGYDFLDLGTTVENGTWSSGLMQFKESFGALGHFRTVYSIDV